MASSNHKDDYIDRLGMMFELQGDLQKGSYGVHPSDITSPSDRISFFKDMHVALTDELHEALNEIGWKPWATSEHFNEEAVQGELVDAFHFFMNLCLVANMSPDMLFEKYKAKRLKNQKRQLEGYDGISTKCPRCKRALDDSAVGCHLTPMGNTIGWCERDQDFLVEEELTK